MTCQPSLQQTLGSRLTDQSQREEAQLSWGFSEWPLVGGTRTPWTDSTTTGIPETNLRNTANARRTDD